MFGIGKEKPKMTSAQIGTIGMPVHINQSNTTLKVMADRAWQRAARLEYQLKKRIARGADAPEYRSKIKMQIRFYSEQHRVLLKQIELMKAFR